MHFIYAFIDMLNEMSPYLLLGFLVAGILYAFVPARFYGRHLAGNGAWAVLKAALIGVPLPLCSCGVLPTAVSLHRNGASKAATTSFLIATPQTGVDSIAATYSLLGPAFAVIRPVAALLTAFFGGMVVGRNERKACSTDATSACDDTLDLPRGLSLWQRCKAALHYGFIVTVGNIGRWLLIGLVIAALITVFVPDGFFTFFAPYPLLAMLAVVVVAVPMYVCSTGSIPIALSLMLKGLSPGAAFVLLMAGPAANFASMIIVSRSLGRRVAILYVTSIVVGAIAIGLGIDYLLPRHWFTMPLQAGASCGGCHFHWELFPTLCSLVLVGLLVKALFFKGAHNHAENPENHKDMILKIKGMSCNHCTSMVQKNLAKLPGVESVTVDLASGEARIEGNPDPVEVRAVIDDLGFQIEE